MPNNFMSNISPRQFAMMGLSPQYGQMLMAQMEQARRREQIKRQFQDLQNLSQALQGYQEGQQAPPNVGVPRGKTSLSHLMQTYQPETKTGLGMIGGMWEKQMQSPESYTLKPGEVRYRGTQPVATGMPKQRKQNYEKITYYSKNGKQKSVRVPSRQYNQVVNKILEAGGTLEKPEEAEQWSEPEKTKTGAWVQRNTKTGRLQSVPKPERPRAREQKIREAMQQFDINQNLATKYVDGYIDVQPNALGQPVIIDTVTGQTRSTIGPQAEMGGSAGRQEPQSGPQSAMGNGVDRSYISPETAKGGTGVVANIQQMFNNLAGWATEGIPFEKTARNRNALRTFNHMALTGIVNNPRFPVAEQQTVKGFLPDPDKFFKDPDEAIQQVENLKDFLRRKIKNKRRVINSKNVSAGQLKTYTDQINNMRGVLDLISTEFNGDMSLEGENHFMQMSAEELAQVDVSTLSDADLEKYLRATEER